MTVDLHTMRRLAYIRYLHHLGAEQARMPEPLSSASVLMLHDAVETFLLLATEFVGENPPAQFERYWDTLDGKLRNGASLTTRQGMRRLNKVRVNLKHHGAHPDAPTIELAVADTQAFMTLNTQLAFGLDYEVVSMTHLITQTRVRELVATAEKANASLDRKAAMVALVDAFEELLNPHQPNERVPFYKPDTSPLTFGPRLEWPLSTDTIRRMFGTPANAHEARRFGDQIEAITRIVDRLRPAVQMAVLSISFADYLRFKTLTPYAATYGDGMKRYTAPAGYSPSGDDVGFCLQFVVTAALRLSEVDSTLARPEWLPTSNRDRRPPETIAEVKIV